MFKTSSSFCNEETSEGVGEDGGSWAKIYSDGWVEQNVVGVSQDVAANSGSGQSFSFNPYSTGSGRVPITSAYYTSTTQVQVGFWNLDSSIRGAFSEATSPI